MASSGKPLVIAHHIMWTAYGWWLPNDPRGSTSRTIRNAPIAELGELHRGRKVTQPAGREIQTFYSQAEQSDALSYPLLSFAPHEFLAVADSIGDAIAELGYTCYACAVMPDHVHLVIRKHRDLAEEMIERLQQRSREGLIEERVRNSDHPTWTRGGWKVFLNHPDDIRRSVRYVDENPTKLRLPRQSWPWVKEYDGWPLHPGHSENSPYVRALRRVGR